MGQSGFTQWPELFRPLRIGTLIAALLLLLAACANAPVLTDSGPAPGKGKTVPPVAFQQVTGLPPGKLAELKAAMAVAGGERDIGIVEGDFQTGSFSLAGQFKAFKDNSGVRILYQWQLRDAEGVLVQTIDGEDNAGLFEGSDPWAVVSAGVMERIARRTAETMAAKLSQLGYATRLSALHVPPAEYSTEAGPNAQREIDFETLNGPGMAMAGLDMEAPPEDPLLAGASVDPLPNEAQLQQKEKPVDAPAPSGDEAQTVAAKIPNAKPAKDGRMQIRAVAVMPVKGSPGGGDAELTSAMRKTLSEAGWPVVTKRQPDALTIVGRVKVANRKGSQQSVSVRWEVQSPDGKTLGDVKQSNDIPKGSLDRGWGRAAFAVAEAAATGIFDIVNRSK